MGAKKNRNTKVLEERSASDSMSTDVLRIAAAAAALAYMSMVMIASMGAALYKVTLYVNNKKKATLAAAAVRVAGAVMEAGKEVVKKKFNLANFFRALWGSAKESAKKVTDERASAQVMPVTEMSVLAVFGVVLVMMGVGCLVATSLLLVEPKVKNNASILRMVHAAVGIQTASQLACQMCVGVAFRHFYATEDEEETSMRLNAAHAAAAFVNYMIVAALLTQVIVELNNIASVEESARA